MEGAAGCPVKLINAEKREGSRRFGEGGRFLRRRGSVENVRVYELLIWNACSD
jgi:hypothetical protein